jgi:hypothetical protein
MEKAFNNNEDGGFQITFDNNCTISVVYHKYSYSDQGKTTAEVAAWSNKTDKWMVFNDGKWSEIPYSSEVMPRKTADEVAELIYTLSKYSTEE